MASEVILVHSAGCLYILNVNCREEAFIIWEPELTRTLNLNTADFNFTLDTPENGFESTFQLSKTTGSDGVVGFPNVRFPNVRFPNEHLLSDTDTSVAVWTSEISTFWQSSWL
jgi:hypothetical protein